MPIEVNIRKIQLKQKLKKTLATKSAIVISSNQKKKVCF
jgi:hypothetical protein